MKKISYIWLAIWLPLFSSCEKQEDELIKKSQFLVDKIYNYNHQLVGDYVYDDRNRLAEIHMYFYDTEEGRRIDYTFVYRNNRVHTIQYKEYQFPQANHTFQLIYNQSDQIVRRETLKNNQLIGTQYYQYDQEGRLACLTDENGNAYSFFDYDDTQNVIQVRGGYVDNGFGGIGDTIVSYRHFVYDHMPRPDFGIDELFFIEPLPGFGTEATFEKGASVNNMTEYVESGTQWIYTYDENNFPKTIETRWKDIETSEPMLLRIEYKKVN